MSISKKQYEHLMTNFIDAVNSGERVAAERCMHEFRMHYTAKGISKEQYLTIKNTFRSMDKV